MTEIKLTIQELQNLELRQVFSNIILSNAVIDVWNEKFSKSIISNMRNLLTKWIRKNEGSYAEILELCAETKEAQKHGSPLNLSLKKFMKEKGDVFLKTKLGLFFKELANYQDSDFERILEVKDELDRRVIEEVFHATGNNPSYDDDSEVEVEVEECMEDEFVEEEKIKPEPKKKMFIKSKK